MANSLYEIQQSLEDEAVGIGVSKYEAVKAKAVQRNDMVNMAPENYLLRQSLLKVSEKIEARIKKGASCQPAAQALQSVVEKIHPHTLAYITLQVALGMSKTEMPLVPVASEIGKRVRHYIDYVTFRKAKKKYVDAVEKSMDSKSGKYKTTVLHNLMKKHDIPVQKWENQNELSTRIGVYLIDRMREAVPLFEMKVRQHHTDTRIAYLCATGKTIDWIEKAHDKCALMSPQYMPMVVKPLPWVDLHSGGFLAKAGAYHIPAVRISRRSVQSAMQDADLSNVYKTLNTLQDVPFRINRRILDVMRECAETGVAGLPSPDLREDLAQPLWANEGEYKELCVKNPDAVKAWKIERSCEYDRWHRKASSRHLLHWQLWTAAKFQEFEQIFFCWNCDWRGRVYPIQQYINPQADSNGKALIEFAEGIALGSMGAYWLGVAGANNFGEDKLPMDERYQWVLDNQDAILDSADNPLDGTRFWMQADKPFLFLAFCFEWAGYCREGDDFKSHYSVNMDGSCSGLQHYSALLHDEIGGRYVNLIPAERPSDIYMKVASVSSDIVSRDIETKYAATWHGKIDRGLTKRNTMTWPYSATLHGFTEQLCEEIDKRDEEARKNGEDSYLALDNSEIFKAANYLARTNLTAISSVVVKAVEAMQYLKDIARLVASCGIDVEWTTPSGMRVTQVYRKVRSKLLRTMYGGMRIKLSLAEDTEKKDANKNASGIAPNFIHSLDASHLVNTINACADQGIRSFTAIHDSFGVHPCHVVALNKTIREEFVKMYSENVLQQFHEQVKQLLPAEKHSEMPQVPHKGTLDLQEVYNSTYFFA